MTKEQHMYISTECLGKVSLMVVICLGLVQNFGAKERTTEQYKLT